MFIAYNENMLKKASLIILAILAFFIIKVYFQSEEKWIKKKTQKLIQMASSSGEGSEIALLQQVSKITKFIHFDVRLKALYEGRIYEAKSLNEARSLFLLYFRHKSNEKIGYSNLKVEIIEKKKKAIVTLSVFFKRIERKFVCQAFLEWIKEKKWYIKKIEVSSCSSKKN